MKIVYIEPDLIISMVQRGASNEDIAKRFGVTTRTLERWRANDPELNRQILAIRKRNRGW